MGRSVAPLLHICSVRIGTKVKSMYAVPNGAIIVILGDLTGQFGYFFQCVNRLVFRKTDDAVVNASQWNVRIVCLCDCRRERVLDSTHLYLGALRQLVRRLLLRRHRLRHQ